MGEIRNILRSDWLIICLIVFFILLFRILYIDLYQSLIATYNFNIETVYRSFVSNVIVLLLSIILDVWGVQFLTKKYPYGKNYLTRFVFDVLLIFVVSAIGALILDVSELNTIRLYPPVWQYYVFLLLSVFIVNAFIVVILDVAFYAFYMRNVMLEERFQKRHAEFQYHKLKEQVNPHFLFNSLNILDYLVQSGEKDKASAYIKKLASIYRYVLQNNDEELVHISDELELTQHYVDLLKLRFSEGIEFVVDVPQDYMQTMVIPLSLQILVENAVKHNEVNKDKPLLIQIKIENDKLLVTNNIQLRMNVNDSMNVGLNNICNQYKDVTGQTVDIEMTETMFVVKLPII